MGRPVAPATGADVKAFTLPDGRSTWLETDANAIVDTIVYGPQTFSLNSVRASSNGGKSVATLNVSGASSTPVTFEVVNGQPGCISTNGQPQPCVFHPEYYSFSPPGGTPPLSTTLNYNGPIGYKDAVLVVHAKAADVAAAGVVLCIQQPAGNPNSSGICAPQIPPSLPMNSLNFNLVSGGQTSSQTSNILSLGGTGYPFAAASSVPWASVSPANGTAPAPLSITVDPRGLAAGTYSGTVTISAESTTEVVALTSVIAGGATPPLQVAAPSLVGSTQADATSLIQQAGLSLGAVTTAASGTVFPGTVISQTPVAGTSVSPGSNIDLVISSGPVFSNLLYFNPAGPCHFVDTRAGNGPFGSNGPPSLSAGQTRVFYPQQACGVAASAKAYSMNITVAPTNTLAYLTVWPTGAAQPVVSTLNAFKGGVVTNGAIVPAGPDGGINVFVTDASDLMIDITGSFDTVPSFNTDSFYAVAPCRMVDTRLANGSFGGPQLSANSSRDFPLRNSPCLPSGGSIGAYSLNATVVPSEPLSRLLLWPTGRVQPSLASTVSATYGDITATGTIVTNGSGSVSVFSSNRTDLVLDTNGYFGPFGNTGALGFQPVSPCRIVDTRYSTPILGGGSRDFDFVGSPCQVPAGVAAYSLNVTVVPRGGLGYLTIWPAGQPQPFISTMNSLDGRIIANAAIVPAGAKGVVSVAVTDTTDVILDINGYFAFQ